MSENTLRPIHPFLFFISRLFILIGMVLVFTFGFLGIGMAMSKYIFGIDLVNEPTLLNDYENNQAVLSALKFIQALNTIGGFLLPAILFPRALQQWPSLFNRISIKPAFSTILIALGIMIVSTPLISWAIHFNEGIVFPASMADLEHRLKEAQTAAEKLTQAFVHADNNWVLLINMLLVALLPAVCEEFLFRGAFMRFLMLCFKNKHLAVFLSALVFSVMHGEFYGLLPRLILGMFLGYIAWYSGSIWPAVAAHFLNNGLALLSLHFHWDKSGIALFDEHYIFPIYAIIGSGVLTIGFIWLMRKITLNNVYYNGE